MSHFELVSVSGPRSIVHGLKPGERITIGRSANNRLHLSGQDRVSRSHAMLVFEEREGTAQWCLIDTNSRHGTMLNGVRLDPEKRYPLAAGDLVEIAPWTFEVVDRSASKGAGERLSTVDDTRNGSTVISEVVEQADELAQRMLNLLLECAESIHSAEQEKQLVAAVLEAAVKGTGIPNVAILKPGGEGGVVEVLGSRGRIGEGDRPSVSRSLIERAQRGRAVQLVRHGEMSMAASIVDLGLVWAICAPIVVGGMVKAHLYLDCRQDDTTASQPGEEAASFAVGLTRLASLAWANLMRTELEKRMGQVEAELRAAAAAQRVVMPQRQGRVGPFVYNGEIRAGQLMSGDFFDVLPLTPQRMAVVIGDVCGKGVAASVLTTAAQGFLHSALLHNEEGDLLAVVDALNRYVSPRCDDMRFITLWLGMFDYREHVLSFVDCGHGYVFGFDANGEMSSLNDGGGPPVGLGEVGSYQLVKRPLKKGEQWVMVSDGVIEQRCHTGPGDAGAIFGLDGVRALLPELAKASDPVGVVFRELRRHAGVSRLDDDVTVVSVRY